MDYNLHYDRLISRARARCLGGYKERHHIIPRCMGGNDKIENIVELTAEEHYVAHQLLVKMNPENQKLALAAAMMAMGSKDNNRKGNKLYSWIRKSVSNSTVKWKSPCHSENGLKTWASADLIYNYHTINPLHGTRRIKRALGAKSGVGGIVYAIKNGWNPSKDPEWVKFSKTVSVEKLEIDNRARDDIAPFLKTSLSQDQKNIWAAAEDICKFHALFPEDGMRTILRCLGLNEKKYAISVLKRIKTGWEPLKDVAWLEFRANNTVVVSSQDEWADLRDTKSGEKSHRFGIKPWRHPMVKNDARLPWLEADKAFELYSNGDGYVKIQQKLGIGKRNAFQILVNKFKCGWIPRNDEDWNLWKQQIQSKK